MCSLPSATDTSVHQRVSIGVFPASPALPIPQLIPNFSPIPNTSTLESDNSEAVSQLASRVLPRPRAAESTPPTTDRPLIQETAKHAALKIYDNIPIPPDTTVILASRVFDGVGDLEHVIHAAHHLADRARNENFKLLIYLKRLDRVPDAAWEAKLATLSRLGVDIYLAQNVSPELHRAGIDAMERLSNQRPLPCVISISTGCSPYPLKCKSAGLITEYGIGIFYDPDNLDMSIMPAGFCSPTFGVWISDDEILTTNTSASVISTAAKKQLFGAAPLDQEMSVWEVGFASLREDEARLAWMRLRLSQVNQKNNCSLVVSSFNNSNTKAQKMNQLAKQYGFERCIIIERDGKEQIVLGQEKDHASRTLRVVHLFIDEEDLPGVMHLARGGSIGGAGDTACVRGLIGEFPMFVESRPGTHDRWRFASDYLKSNGFPTLANWILCSLTPSEYSNLPKLATSVELTQEWRVFRNRAMHELDIGPWIARYVRRCVFVSSEYGEQIEAAETAHLQGSLNDAEYAEKIRDLTTKQTQLRASGRNPAPLENTSRHHYCSIDNCLLL